MNSKNAFAYKLLYSSVYFMSYFTRYTYSAVLAELIISMGVTKSQASIALTGFFVIYGISQIFSGVLGDKFQPKYVILTGLIGTSIVNLSMIALPNIYTMAAVWMLNGFFQSLFWPPLVRMVCYSFQGSAYNKTITMVSQACNVATICLYLGTAGIIAISTWKIVFLVSGLVGVAFSAVWFIATRHISLGKGRLSQSVEKNADVEKSGLGFKTLVKLGMLPIFFAVIVNGSLRDGVSTWLSTYLNEKFDFGTSFSIMSSAVIPLFGILCLTIASIIVRHLRNELKGASLFYFAGGILSLVLVFFFNRLIPVDILLFALISGTMHGANLILIADLPRYFSKFGKISTVSGILNAFVYAGSAISTYGIAALEEHFGWRATFIVWVIIAIFASGCCLLSSRHWKDIESYQ